jgi:hypothetical protein
VNLRISVVPVIVTSPPTTSPAAGEMIATGEALCAARSKKANGTRRRIFMKLTNKFSMKGMGGKIFRVDILLKFELW